MSAALDDRELYEEYAVELVRFATGLVGPHDAPDIVADAFLAICASPVWLVARDRRALWYRAVVYRAKSETRSTTRRLQREVMAASHAHRFVPGPATPDLSIDAALKQLSPQQRAVVVLTYWADLPAAEVAAILGVSEGSVKKQLARGRERLRKELE